MTYETSFERVGFAGLGAIGLPMALRLVERGVPLVAYNRTPAKVDTVVAAGATRADSPRLAAQAADVVITCLAGPAADEEIYLGRDGLLAADIAGKLFVNTSTIGPVLARRLAGEVQSRGASYIDCPLMSGGPATAYEGRMVLPVGGTASDLARAMPILRQLATTIEHVGECGTGQVVKLANNIQLATSAVSLAQALRFSIRAGVDPSALGRVLVLGSSRSYAMERYLDDMLSGNYQEHGSLSTLAKDAAIAVEFAAAVGEQASIGAAAAAVLAVAADTGYANLDVAAVIEAGGPFRGPGDHHR